MRVVFILFGFCWSYLSWAGINDEAKHIFARQYFSAWQATQTPDATESDIDAYLALLTDDVGYQHLPYVPSGLRRANGKIEMKKGLMYYLGTTASYKATLDNVIIGHNVIVLQYRTVVSGIHPDTQLPTALNYRSVDVLEIYEGKVAVIRHYSE
ncbi:nuclear transport factor 2 family protein [Alteromonas sp. ASW11-130]|uniref:nuclear transport factor 2 family protein n=1 Tax=Alteromonas sp. ASW11-130 TaxID=3015775 RepID=UPI002241ED79|nr:nuclear transport factor 2 family protein [Alteromonas sp. ASW11-130]MCW8090830.1 nuclear transport factor 2 family protein [Alteromonas sp. ASW11-130]